MSDTFTSALEVRNVSVSFDGIHALTEVSVHVGAGELLGLIGPNGAGKTTLVNVMSGYQRPTTGTVSLAGRDITRWNTSKRARQGLVRTFQGVRLFGHLSVLENIEVSALGRTGRSAARKHADHAIEVLGLQHAAHTAAGDLPYGDQRRLAIARCLAMEPRVMLMDEPAAGLNEQETVELGDTIEVIRRENGCAIVLIEHDVALVMRLSDRICVLAGGTPLTTGTPEQVREDPAVIAAYLGVKDA